MRLHKLQKPPESATPSTVTVTIGERRKTPGPFGRVDATAGSDPAVMLDDLETELARRWLVMRPDAATLLVCEPSIPVRRPLGVEGPIITPGSDEWLSTISASKIAAIAGVSPWESPFSLYWKMAGQIVEPTNDAMRRGNYLEDGIARWFADRHPELVVLDSGTWTHVEHHWATATPDRTLAHRHDITDGCRLLEIKTTTASEEWGAPGSDEVPPYVACQVQWQMFVTGLDVCHVAVLGAFLEFAEYEVPYDAAEAERLRSMAFDFLGKLERRERPPIDDHDATYQAQRVLHPDIDRESDVELSDELCREYVYAQQLADIGKRQLTRATSLLADEMGDARRARWCGYTIATRQARNNGIPYLVKGRDLPSFDEEESAA